MSEYSYEGLVQPQTRTLPPEWGQKLGRGVLDGIANLVMSPKRAMDRGMTTEQAIPWAFDTAALLAGVGAPNATPGSIGAFGGRPPRIFNNTEEWMPGLPKMAGENLPQAAPMTPGGWLYPQPKYAGPPRAANSGIGPVPESGGMPPRIVGQEARQSGGLPEIAGESTPLIYRPGRPGWVPRTFEAKPIEQAANKNNRGLFSSIMDLFKPQ